jgi:hypothetical protein
MRRILVSVFCCVCFLCAHASATVLAPIEFRQLVTSSPVIVHGTVVDVRSDWVDGRRAVETFVTVEAGDYLKGDLGPRVTFKVPGGQLGRYRTIFVGAPTFQSGDELVLFLKSNGASYPFITGLSQGLFRVVTDRTSGRRLVTPPAVVGKPGVDERVVRGDPARRPLPLDDFRALVRQMQMMREPSRGRDR